MQKTFTASTATTILTILYAVGIIGFLWKIYPNFPQLTPFNLLISLGIALVFHQNWNGRFAFWCFATAFVGYLIEVAGVATGAIFGNYIYGNTLGIKVLEVPLSISINWLLSAYGSAALVSVAASKSWHWFFKSVAAAALMVSLDVLIEPIAVKTGMWTWANGVVPMQNFGGWFVVALALQMLFFTLVGAAKNKVAVALLILQFAFFTILNWFM